MPARRIGQRYELIEEIGFGGFGSVWRGYDTVLDREIAVKMIRFTQINSPSEAAEFAERFRREARITARIRHHGVPQVYDAVLDAELSEVYLVMELIEGATTLRHYLGGESELPVQWAVAVTAQTATALSYAHALPVVHRDLKPDNILVTPNGTVKVIDFGIAALLTPGAPKLTATGVPLGSAAYMAPEQTIGAKATPRTDLYALGCVLYEMLCGYPVFSGAGPIVMHHHYETPPVPPREIRADVPVELDDLVVDLLAKKPDDRPVDAAEVYERLLPLLPASGSVLDVGAALVSGVPDPTAIFRRPNAPLRPDRVAPTARFQHALEPTTPISDEVLEQQLNRRVDEYRELIADNRPLQAAGVLGDFLEGVGAALGTDSQRVLDLRFDVALARFLGGEIRVARSEFEALATTCSRVLGFTHELTIDCRKFAVDCRIELGELTEALAEMRAVTADVRAVQTDGSETALDMRLALGRLLALVGHRAEARTTLTELVDDLLLIRGVDDALTQEASAALARLTDDDPVLGDG
ncbi:serine/threonine-protein kinase [Nocardia sp. NPDC056064]|uniref:serine/threonine-protein kinase n=1 Tax=Nocardia sp. NPDC056064 TaxID=3345701 RepID=UPI0035D8190E